MAEGAAVVIRAGRGDEGAVLKEIALRSKAHWGYDPARLRERRARLGLMPLDDYIKFIEELTKMTFDRSSLPTPTR